MKSLFKIYMIQKFSNHIKILSKKKDQIAFSNFLNRIQLLKKIKLTKKFPSNNYNNLKNCKFLKLTKVILTKYKTQN